MYVIVVYIILHTCLISGRVPNKTWYNGEKMGIDRWGEGWKNKFFVVLLCAYFVFFLIFVECNKRDVYLSLNSVSGHAHEGSKPAIPSILTVPAWQWCWFHTWHALCYHLHSSAPTHYLTSTHFYSSQLRVVGTTREGASIISTINPLDTVQSFSALLICCCRTRAILSK